MGSNIKFPTFCLILAGGEFSCWMLLGVLKRREFYLFREIANIIPERFSLGPLGAGETYRVLESVILSTFFRRKFSCMAFSTFFKRGFFPVWHFLHYFPKGVFPV